jgi:hypothetical protein
MRIYELRETETGYALSGGQLEEVLQYPEPDAIEYAARMVGFLAQTTGAELGIFAADGRAIETKTFRVCAWPTGATLGNFQDAAPLHAATL